MLAGQSLARALNGLSPQTVKSVLVVRASRSSSQFFQYMAQGLYQLFKFLFALASRGLCNNMDSSSFLCAISTVGNQLPHHPAPPRASLPLRIMHTAAGPYLARQEPRVSKTISLRGQYLLYGRVTVPICGDSS